MRRTLMILTSCALLCGCTCQGSSDGTAESPSTTSSTTAPEGTAAAQPEGAADENAGPIVGQPAPDFTLLDTDGHTHTLSDLNGKIVVLEWYNPDCPFVRYAHTRGSLTELASMHEESGVVWLAVNSGGPGKQGHGLQRNRASREELGVGHPILLDAKGEVGRLYGAKTTPQMFVISRDGLLAYAGAIDNFPMGKITDGDKPREYVTATINDLTNDRAVAVPVTQPYGCSVKY